MIESNTTTIAIPADIVKPIVVAAAASEPVTNSPPREIQETVPALSEAELNNQVAEKVDQLNRLAKDRNLSVEFSVDESTNRQVVRIIDKATGEVRMQLPSEAALTVSKNLDALQGVFLDDFV